MCIEKKLTKKVRPLLGIFLITVIEVIQTMSMSKLIIKVMPLQ